MTRPTLLLSLKTTLAVLGVGLFSSAPLPVGASSAREAITQLCLAGFQAVVSGSGKEPPAGMATYTCSCFVDQVSQKASLSDAQAICTKLASSRFKFN